jgi:hypothetical protein
MYLPTNLQLVQKTGGSGLTSLLTTPQSWMDRGALLKIYVALHQDQTYLSQHTVA